MSFIDKLKSMSGPDGWDQFVGLKEEIIAVLEAAHDVFDVMGEGTQGLRNALDRLEAEVKE